MSVKYDNYLETHKANVRKGYEWFAENLPWLLSRGSDNIERQICWEHDYSKTSMEEYEAYAKNNRVYEIDKRYL